MLNKKINHRNKYQHEKKLINISHDKIFRLNLSNIKVVKDLLKIYLQKTLINV